MKYTEEQKWKAFIECDANYDGCFYIGVKSTGIYCRPSCKARKPLRKNIEFIDTRDECERRGYRVCKRCRPDLIVFTPEKDTAKRLKGIIEETYKDSARLKERIDGLDLSFNHISLIFQKEYGMTPFSYRNMLRLEKAEKLLKETDMQIVDIAFASGFDSLSAFYASFKKHRQKPPKSIRR
ncbi:AraC family transcriptional regulator of adaptative response / methylphosphotriester-DNA alkyltransferase methyltransferase [Breznakia sp. PF5-3]|uniref:bifunctional transcriptional activator/DNA repair enzyme AdaA n=1 Tax=unclassified Breznakia TaxID=2623764 RepID=UPI0024063963|nr:MULTISPECIES: Ada metal-binding domain-containing protein [unclassified Breznakia]MDF9824120.1 AraC family transcriptional regulator of adaptative response / methylphosphotriester-DNA alkyltransferase methyltransferase [Breznakia sp. PM6-1]MDF9834918.1 AraC family transcriptional regulator of adaptative response / methylphosphotriester-DNA alkyltransferase methyltransferase [Breznakia sp. PF5-3]MDF9837213.1 AraC family transcriptional regulator of adaptative response / methylphosphotriester-D